MKTSATMAIVSAAALVLAGSACERERGIGEPTDVGSEVSGAPTPGGIARNPAAFVGKDVEVTAEVGDVHGPHAFTLEEDAAFAGPDVLVIVSSAVPETFEGEDVTVRGKVQRYDRAAFERDHPWFDADALGDTDFTSRPVIVATTVRGPDGEEIVASSGPPPRAPADPDDMP